MRNLLKAMSVILAVAIFGSGCASYAVYKSSERRVAERKAIASGDEAAIKAVRMGDSVGIGIDVTNLEALTEQPWLQAGAAILDAILIYGAKEYVDGLNDSGSDNSGDASVQVSVDNSDDTTITINTERDDETTTTTTNDDHSENQQN